MKRPVQLYRHFDAAGRLLYVGISLSTLVRLTQHRRESRWFDEIARIEIERFPSYAEAEHAERLAIQTENPIHNTHRWRPHKEMPFQPETEIPRFGSHEGQSEERTRFVLDAMHAAGEARGREFERERRRRKALQRAADVIALGIRNPLDSGSPPLPHRGSLGTGREG